MLEYTLDLCGCHKKPFNTRSVLTDEEGTLYLFEYEKSFSAVALTISTHRFENGKVVTIENPRTTKLMTHIKQMRQYKRGAEIQAFINPLFDTEFEIPALHKEKLGDWFCNVFLTDTDEELIYQKPNAMHPILDFNHFERTGEFKIKTPPLFPFVIEKLDITVTEDAKLFNASGKEIDRETFDTLYDSYRASLLPKLREKEQAYAKIEADLKRLYYLTKDFALKNGMDESSIETISIDVYDSISQAGVPVLTVYYSEVSFTDTQQYSLGYWGFPEFKMCNLLYYMLERFDERVIETEFTFYPNVELLVQLEYKC
jgi:hypothetical protein